MIVLFYVALTLSLGSYVESINSACLLKPSVNASYVTFTLYNQENINGVVLKDDNLTVVDSTLRIVFIIHGWLQKGNQPWIILMKDSYLKVENTNVIVVDWSKYSSCAVYSSSAAVVPEIGVIIGNFVGSLITQGRGTLPNTQINGFSLGGHVAGIAGQQVQALLDGFKIGRINGLDAASIGFEDAPLDSRLDAGDATFVQAFHTSNYGIQQRYGTIDVYFNYKNHHCGENQPGCPFRPGVPLPTNFVLPIIFCDHIRSVSYFTCSIGKPSDSFLAVRCNCKDFGSKSCGSNSIVVGEYCPDSAPPGTYYLNTNCKKPFGLGNNGTVGGRPKYHCLL